MSHAVPALSGISLRQLLPDGQFVGSRDVFVRSCCGHWSECEPDDLYVAIVDSDSDGHDHVGQAIQRGACGVVGERLLAIRSPQCIVEDTRQAYGRVCHALAGDPSTQLTAIGVTGSAGKTVTAHLIGSILASGGAPAGVLSSIESQPSRGAHGRFEVNSPRLAKWLATQVLEGRRHAILEAASCDLAQHCFAGTELDVAVITNLRREHLNFHTTTENYRQAKARLLDYLKPTGFSVVNADDPHCAQLLDRLDCPALTFGLRAEAEVTGRVLETSLSEQTILIRAGNQSVPVRTRMIGQHHVSDCLAAAAVALALGWDLPQIAQGLERAESIPGRLEGVRCGQPFGVFVDVSDTPQQLATALHALRQVTRGRLICVATQHRGQSADDRRRIGKVLEKSADHAILTSEQLAPPLIYEPFHQVLDGFDRPQAAQIIPDRIRAVEQALAWAQPADTVLIAGCGDRPIVTVGDESWQINDRDVCQAWLYDHAFRESWEDPRIYRIDDYR
jgi:UDP-N-acetylmuramoyl-L-alanyl-D-glutamate--2,6-diaminopimelate ligase